MSLGILHGYLLEGSGSNLWTRAIVRALCRAGETVHLVCQEPHPEDYDFIAGFVRHDGAEREVVFERDVDYPGRCVMHKPKLGDVLPVYVPDRYEEFERVVPMVELPDAVIEDYVARNVEVVRRVVEEGGVEAVHANHAVLMSVVAERVAADTGVPFALMPHGSAIEYAVRKDERFLRMAESAFAAASRVFVIGDEMRERVRDVFGGRVEGIEDKLSELNLGVDTALFEVATRAERPAEIREMEASLASLERGRTPAQERLLRERLEEAPPATLDAFREAVAPDVEYDLKSPDGGVEDKLASVDWETDPVVLFVGRLIANKGPQAVLAAVPAVLRERPDARFVFVGHGPLREPLEAMAWAMEHGDAALVRRIAEWGTALEDGDGEPFVDVASYLDGLERDGRLEAWAEDARRVSPRNVIFTGYLTHTELRHLFASADVAVFPSLIREAGPLVFLEALASGCYPLGTDFGGMAASIAAVGAALGDDVVEPMRLSAERARLTADIARSVPPALELAARHGADLRALAVERYDWTNVARRLAGELHSLGTR